MTTGRHQLRTLPTAVVLFALSTFNAHLSTAMAQGTAFTYQGQLQSNGGLASGTYNLTFSLYTNSAGGTAVASPVTNSAVAVTNGLFAVAIDFGGGVWNGETNWLQIGVETNGGASFTPLSPRQQLTPAPYAIFAEGATAAGIRGAIASANVSGSYSNALTLNNAGNVFTGNGSGLTGVNATLLNGLAGSNFWQTAGNLGTSPTKGNFVGTADNQPVEMHVNGQRALRLEPNTSGAPNVIAGSPVNFAASGVSGAAIGGGGAIDYLGVAYTNSVTADFGAVGGGVGNTVGNNYGTVGGGFGNYVTGGSGAVIGGDFQRRLWQLFHRGRRVSELGVWHGLVYRRRRI